MRKIYSRLVIALLMLTYSCISIAQDNILKGIKASEFIEGTVLVRLSDRSDIPSFIGFAEGKEPDLKSFTFLLKKRFKIDNSIEFSFISSETDQLGGINYKYYQSFNGVPIYDATFTVHSVNDKVQSIFGNIYADVSINNEFVLDEGSILKTALDLFPSELYKWQIPEEEILLQEALGDKNATYLPSPEKVLFPVGYPDFKGKYTSSYKLTIYSDKPLFKKEIIIDAQTGIVLIANEKINHADVLATANTKYSAVQEITTDSYNGSYRLRETARGNGIETYDMNTGTSYNSSVDFTDADNYWNNYNAQFDEVATDAHWGAEMTYDYYYFIHGRNSIDNNGFKLRNYVHYDDLYSNAFWDGTRMTFGDGNGGSTGPLVASDIVGHEITHGLTEHTANLDYAYESGALNEGYSDIFGTAIEFYAKPSDANWTIGEDIGYSLRSMSNPNYYSMPDTYLGNYWYSGTDDNGGVHYNSSVINYWFYLTSVGGGGTNDLGNSYLLSGIGIIDAGKIAFRTLTVYLNSTSEYEDARFFSIMAAIDLFGGCSPEVEAVTKAWYAVGIGPNYVNTVLSDFSGDFLQFCQTPALVHFTNNSVNGTSFVWNFGDGTSSTLLNPTHSFTNYGLYTVSLMADGGICGSDTLIQTAYISVDPSNPCVSIMNPSGSNPVQTSCSGTLYDTGGQDNYQNDINSIFTINPANALSVTLTFISFDFEPDYDYLYIYDGPNISSPLIGQYSGSSLPNGGIIQSSGSSITIRQTSDVYLTESGFELTWQCDYANTAPVTAFYAIPVLSVPGHRESCTGVVQFHDFSSNGATQWLWYFGDGGTSTYQHPSHTYLSDGLYTIKLVSSNPYGIDSVTYADYISIVSPVAPVVTDGYSCSTGAVNLTASGTGALAWFTEETGGELIATGENYITPYISTTTEYWVQAYAKEEFDKVGKPDNSGGGGNFNSAYVHYLVFDCYVPINLLSVKVYSQNAGNRLIKLNNSAGNTIAQRIVNIPQGESRIFLGFDIPAGTDYQLAGPESPDLYRNNSGTQYPYDLFGIASVKYSSASTDPTGYYYYFYDWEIMSDDCKSERVPVNAEIMDTPLADFTFVNDSGYVTFTNSSNSSTEYFWDFGDGQTSTLENPVHSFSSTGIFNVSLISINECGSDTISYNVNVTITSIDESEIIDGLEIYPNPVNDNLYISFVNNLAYTGIISLYDIIGNLIWQENNNSVSGEYNVSIDMKSFPAGMYFLRINSDNNVITRKIIKE